MSQRSEKEKEIKDIWEKKSKGLIIPEITLAYDNNFQEYYVYEDRSTILYLYLERTNVSFAIPKMYCEKKGNVYIIMDIFALIPISCPKKNKYQNFVQENIVPKITTP
jgi:hypothetical protein